MGVGDTSKGVVVVVRGGGVFAWDSVVVEGDGGLQGEAREGVVEVFGVVVGGVDVVGDVVDVVAEAWVEHAVSVLDRLCAGARVEMVLVERGVDGGVGPR